MPQSSPGGAEGDRQENAPLDGTFADFCKTSTASGSGAARVFSTSFAERPVRARLHLLGRSFRFVPISCFSYLS
jgi:hypothetical protein